MSDEIANQNITKVEDELLFDAYHKSQDPRDLIMTEEIIRTIAEYERIKAGRG